MTSRYSIGPGTVLALLAGRGSYRLIQLAAKVLLLATWGAAAFGSYAAALASFAWLTALVFTGPEKAALKLIPRAKRTGQVIARVLLILGWALPVPLLVAYAVTLAFGGRGAPTLYLGVATMMLGTGCTLLLIGLHRAAGRPRADLLSFMAMSATQVLLLAAAMLGGLEPLGHVTATVIAVLGLNAILTMTFPQQQGPVLYRRGHLRRLMWTAVQMGGPDVCLYLSTAVLFALLASSVWAGQVGGLFVVESVWSAAVNLLIYVLRVHAPGMSLRLLGEAGHDGRRRAARIAVAVTVANVVWLALAALALVVAGSVVNDQPVVVAAILLATRTPLLAALIWAAYLLENSDAAATRSTGLAAVLGLCTATVAGAVLVSVLGSAGVIISLATAELAQSLVIARARLVPGHRTQLERADVVA